MILFLVSICLLTLSIIFERFIFVYSKPFITLSYIFELILLTTSILIIIFNKKVRFKILNIATSILFITFSIFAIVPNSILLFKTDNTKTYQTVVHASGSKDGNTYLNSKESFLDNAASDNADVRYIELDFLFTQDNKIVCSHAYENIQGYSLENRPTYEEFENYKILGKYFGITFNWLIETLSRLPNIKIVFDSKEQNILPLISAMIDFCNNNDFDIFNRFIIQIYSVEDYEKITPLGFSELWFTNYRAKYSGKKINSYFANKADLSTIVLPYNTWIKFKSENWSTNKKIGVHTVNANKDIKFLAKRGVDFIYSD